MREKRGEKTTKGSMRYSRGTQGEEGTSSNKQGEDSKAREKAICRSDKKESLAVSLSKKGRAPPSHTRFRQGKRALSTKATLQHTRHGLSLSLIQPCLIMDQDGHDDKVLHSKYQHVLKKSEHHPKTSNTSSAFGERRAERANRKAPNFGRILRNFDG